MSCSQVLQDEMMMKRTMRRLAVVVVLMLSQALAHPHHRPANDPGEIVNTAYNKVQEALDLKENDVTLYFDPVITIMSPLKPQHDKVFVMNATLEVYLQILSRVLAEHPPGPGGPGVPGGPGDLRVEEARPALRTLQKELLRVQKRYYQDNQNNPLQTALDTLRDIKVDDPLVQRQALAEFKTVLHAASCVGLRTKNHTC